MRCEINSGFSPALKVKYMLSATSLCWLSGGQFVINTWHCTDVSLVVSLGSFQSQKTANRKKKPTETRDATDHIPLWIIRPGESGS